jgi:signal transduction histidine kinase/CheY-like chemotaxis protein
VSEPSATGSHNGGHDELLFDRIPTGAAVADRDFTRLHRWNPTWAQITTVLGQEDLSDLTQFRAHCDAEDLTQWLAALADLTATGSVSHTMMILPPTGSVIASDGTARLGAIEPQWWKISAALIDPDDPLSEVVLGLSDTTEEIRLQNQLTEAAHLAGEANRTKTEFLSRVSHELRTPLQGVLGFVQLIQLNPRDPDTPRYLELATQAGEQMVQLITELQEITRIEEGHVDLSLGAVNLSAVIADVVMMFETEAKARQISVRTEGLDIPAVLASDRRRIHQILANLVSNGIKYNAHAGALTITVHRSGPQISVTVADTGPGLSEEQLQRMFTPFDRLGAESSEVAGTGIGLVVARQLAEALGGTLTVDSSLGEGSRFTLHMECPMPHAVDRPISMLCVDDNFASRTVIEAAFSNWEGLRLRTAGTAKAALAMAAVERPDLLLVDIHLPDRDGCDLIPEFRAMIEPGQRLHVAVISADTSPETMSRVAASGVDRFFPKPLKLNELMRYVTSTVAR